MNDDKKPERIPLPPVVLTVVPTLAAAVAVGAGIVLAPDLSPAALVAIGVVVFAITLAVLARRVRRDDG